jgi:hypothetical protein
MEYITEVKSVSRRLDPIKAEICLRCFDKVWPHFNTGDMCTPGLQRGKTEETVVARDIQDTLAA